MNQHISGQQDHQNDGIRIYGVSGASVRHSMQEITGVGPGKRGVRWNETGRVQVSSEKGGSMTDVPSGGGESCGDIGVCIVILLVLMVLVAVI